MSDSSDVVERCEHHDEAHRHATDDELETLAILVGILTAAVMDVDTTHLTLSRMREGEARDQIIDEYNGMLYSLWAVCRAYADHYEEMYGYEPEETEEAVADVFHVVSEGKRMGLN